MSRPSKILLLGAKGFDFSGPEVTVRCVPWDRLNTAPSIADFDLLIVDALSLSEDSARERVDLGAFTSHLNFESAIRVLRSGTILVLGDPRFQISGHTESRGRLAPSVVAFLYWVGVELTWHHSSGDTKLIETGESSFLPYLAKLGRWEYSLQGIKENSSIEGFLRNHFIGFISCEARIEVLASNRYGGALAFTLRHCVDLADKTVKLGPIIFLPPIAASEEETLQIVLRDYCDVKVGLPEPEWAKTLEAPGQKAIDGEVGRMEAQIETLSSNLQKARDQRETARQSLRLLYERQFALEPIVRETLRSLGATVEESEDSTESDGWVTVTVGDRTLEFVLEVKSTAKPQFDEYGIRQLADWVKLGIHERDRKGKGLFIGVASLNEPPDTRKIPFPQNWVNKLKLHGFSALRTEDLYAAYVADREGKLSRDRFWTTLHDTNGVVGAEDFGLVGPDRDLG